MVGDRVGFTLCMLLRRRWRLSQRASFGRRRIDSIERGRIDAFSGRRIHRIDARCVDRLTRRCIHRIAGWLDGFGDRCR